MMFESPTRQGPDERIKLLVFATYVTWLILLKGFLLLGAVIGVMALLLLAVAPGPRNLFTRWIKAVPIALMVVVVFLVFAPAEETIWFALLGKSFGPHGLKLGLFFAVRFLGFLLGGFYLYQTSSPERIARALLWFCAPLRVLKIPVYLFYYITWFAMRSIPVLAEEAQIIRLAQQARGARRHGSPTARLAGVLSLVLPVFAASVRRSDRFALALQARGFDPHEHYRCHPPGGLTHGDIFWVAGLLAAWVLFAVWRWRIF